MPLPRRKPDTHSQLKPLNLTTSLGPGTGTARTGPREKRRTPRKAGSPGEAPEQPRPQTRADPKRGEEEEREGEGGTRSPEQRAEAPETPQRGQP